MTFEITEQSSQTSVELSDYAQRAYLDYAMSVVMGRALPNACDGQKPVQRRILYAMHKMGLHSKAKHVKSARVVGDVLGKFHAHGDSSVYDAAVRMSQNFALRYPLVDGQGNFGDRDGSGAAAMRYTEARLTPIAELLLEELDLGTVDFVPNYDGTLTEPALLPARLPVGLLNGASGIAVGMATEIPSHNLREVADACELLIRNPDATLQDVMKVLPAPDFPCGAQIISKPEDIAKAYATGRGSLRVRARWTVEKLAKGQWQVAVTELPPDASTAKVMLEIESLINPQIKPGKKTLTPEQTNLRALILSVVDRISDDSDGEHPVRLLIEPKSSKLQPDEVMQVLLAHTSLECNAPLNMVMLGLDHKPQQKGLLQVLQEWVAFRFETVTRRTNHRLGQVRARKHILQGRIQVFLNIDAVIEVIRSAEEPRAELMTRFGLSEIQATDILEIRLRQLANLERMKLEGELLDLDMEDEFLQGLLDKRDAMRDQILLELASDRLKYGDDRRTLVATAEKITTSAVVAAADDPVTLIVSKNGWLRARTGHKLDLASLTWKAGDELLTVIETRSAQTVVVLDNKGRAYNLNASQFPTGRGDGVPVTSLVDLGVHKVSQVFVLDPAAQYLVSNSGGYGFLCPAEAFQTRQKAGKDLVTLDTGEELFAPLALPAGELNGDVAAGTAQGKMLVFPLEDVKSLSKGGRGVQLVNLGANDRINAVYTTGAALSSLAIVTLSAESNTQSTKVLAKDDLNRYRGKRARAGFVTNEKAPIVGFGPAV